MEGSISMTSRAAQRLRVNYGLGRGCCGSRWPRQTLHSSADARRNSGELRLVIIGNKTMTLGMDLSGASGLMRAGGVGRAATAPPTMTCRRRSAGAFVPNQLTRGKTAPPLHRHLRPLSASCSRHRTAKHPTSIIRPRDALMPPAGPQPSPPGPASRAH